MFANLNAVALKDYKDLTKIAPQRESVLAPSSHPAYKDTGEDPSGGSSATTLDQIEDVLGKQFIAMPYLSTDEAFSAHMFNFPTKYTDLDSVRDNCDADTPFQTASTWAGFDDNNQSCCSGSQAICTT
ncbi:MAG: hypothetical protein U5L00_21140 [Desulfovermiculus sp.]|nr:hypothetical protein [Desulfovermiculus sp.]